MRRYVMLFAVILSFLWVMPAFPQCNKNVRDNGVIQEILQQYFKTSEVSGEANAVVDWCYYDSRDQLFIFSELPYDSDTEAMTMLNEIGLAILQKCRSHQKLGQALSPFEQTVLTKGFTMSTMRPHGSGPLATYVNPSKVP